MFFSKPAGDKFVDRGEAASPDFDKDDFSDGWQDLDLSGIIPPKTKVVFLNVTLKSSAGKTAVTLMTKGSAGGYNVVVVVMQVIGIQVSQIVSVVPDADGFVSLNRGAGVTWTLLNVTVASWIV